MLTFNVGQSDRVLLRRGIGTGEISASDLSEMSSADLANEQAKQDMEKAAQEALHQSILKVQTALPRAKITHKGEEIIESNASEDLRVAREEEEQERVRTRLRIRTGSILESPESAAAIGSAARMASSVFGGNQPGEMIDGTPMSPEKMFSPDGAAIHGTTSLSPIIGSHIVSSPVQETSSPLNEALVSPRTAVHTSRPSFDLNSLWSRQGGERSQRDHASAMPDVKNFGEDDDEVAMDLDDEQPGEEDFGMFLDGVEEKGNANSSAVRSTTPPPPIAEGLDALPVVWSGEVSIRPLD
jgi:Transcription factor S-II (TFIIS), central domain